MGMFDHIKCNDLCECGSTMTFQSKDGPCELLTLEPKDVNNFYGYCDNRKCNKFYNYDKEILDYKFIKTEEQ